ncbi:hypothetical protein THII_2125 [Thioploca ingrica]|uniref:Uncharacterized protein n=1 Tax=Thioploca ingrica TaxID=40754 RepID=A0A090AL21_9GAMM|nr:hypothetical protein THII_2125 [Thioploca ingrica]
MKMFPKINVIKEKIMNSQKKRSIMTLIAGLFILLSSFVTNAQSQPMVVVLNYDRPAPAVDNWMGWPGFNPLGYWEYKYPVTEPWTPVPMERALGCYERTLPGGIPINDQNLPLFRSLLGQSVRAPVEDPITRQIIIIIVVIRDVYVIRGAESCQQLKDDGLLPKPTPLLATGVELDAFTSGNGVDLTLTTLAEPNTAGLTILRGEKLDNGGTKITAVCEFNSGGSPYTCTDNAVGDVYRVLEKEYNGNLIVYDEVVPK